MKKLAVVAPGQGRPYPMGSLEATFKADTHRYSISEWWLDPYTRGPGKHQHDEDDVFYMLDGTMTFFVGGKWIEATKGTLVIARANTPHDFENRTNERAGFLNVSVPGDFEPHMKGIAQWFRERPEADTRTKNAPKRKSKR